MNQTTGGRAQRASRVVARAWRRERIAGWVHWAALGSAFVFLLVVNRHRWFDTDEWNALVDRKLLGGGGSKGLFEPHNEHWSTIPVVLYRILFSIFALRSYVPYSVMVTLAHLLVAQLLWLLLRRLGVDPWVCVVAVTAFAFLGAGVDDIIFPWQVSFDVSAAAGLAALLVAPTRGPWERRDVAMWGLLLVGLASSGVGLTMVGVVAVVQLLRRGWRVAAATLSVPAVVYAIWYAAYGKDASTPGQQPIRTALQHVPAYVWKGLTDPVSTTLGLAGVGSVVIVVLGVWTAKRGRLDGSWALALGMALGAPTFLALTAIRRFQLGIETAAASRYAYVVLLLLVPLAALGVDALIHGVTLRAVVIIGGLGLLLLVGTSEIKRNADSVAIREQNQEARVLATAELTRTTNRFLSPVPVPIYIPNLTTDKIRRLDRAGDLPSKPITPSDRLDALEYVQLLVGPDLGLSPSGAAIVGASGDAIRPGPTFACVTATAAADVPTVRFRLTGPVSIAVTSERDGQLSVMLQQGQARGQARPFAIRGGQLTYLNIDAPGSDALVTVPPLGATQFCRTHLDASVSISAG